MIELKAKRFSDLGFKEREHLQEWLADCPNALGEELLIIQKEFDGFDDTREQLDLLALDRNGNLFLIENKLDDSGRDVVWQSLKYASYCSALMKADIVRVFQAYLGRDQARGNATQLICDFLEAEDFNDIILNSRTEQRIKLVAANLLFCKLLLLNIKCIHVQTQEIPKQIRLPPSPPFCEAKWCLEPA